MKDNLKDLARLIRCLHQIANGIQQEEEAADRGASWYAELGECEMPKDLDEAYEELRFLGRHLYKLLGEVDDLPSGVNRDQLWDAVMSLRHYPPKEWDIRSLRDILDRAATVYRLRGDTNGRRLTMAQKTEYKEYGYKCRDRISITGEVLSTRRNLILVNDNEVPIGDKDMELLLILVEGSRAVDGGWVDSSTLAPLGVNPQLGQYQPLSRLRRRFEGKLMRCDPKSLIERNRAKGFRISTHPDFVACDKEKLLEHPNNSVRKIAQKLP